MAEARDPVRQGFNAFNWTVAPGWAGPIIHFVTDVNARLLQDMASAQQEWADLVQRRVNEDLALSHQIMNCQSLPDVYELYSRYLRRALEQYQQQSRRMAERLQSEAKQLGDIAESRGREAEQHARH